MSTTVVNRNFDCNVAYLKYVHFYAYIFKIQDGIRIQQTFMKIEKVQLYV